MRFYNSSKIDLICRCHFCGGGGGTPPPMPKFEMPRMPKMPPPPAPLPERADENVADAQMQARQSAAQREGVRKSVLAGETGGYSNPVTGNSLLG